MALQSLCDGWNAGGFSGKATTSCQSAQPFLDPCGGEAVAPQDNPRNWAAPPSIGVKRSEYGAAGERATSARAPM
jgi:hypothetical protein